MTAPRLSPKQRAALAVLRDLDPAHCPTAAEVAVRTDTSPEGAASTLGALVRRGYAYRLRGRPVRFAYVIAAEAAR